jgi:hypothetical protein
MAKIIEDIVIIKLSKLVKENNVDPDPVITTEQVYAIEQVAQELVGDSVIIEVMRDGN